jgi:Complex I intermediate-associated protein 30 (CIA30)
MRTLLLCFLLSRASVVVGLASERRPWDAIRFVQQSSKFVPLPFVSRNLGTVDVAIGDVLYIPEGIVSTVSPFTMAPLDDVVMGGASSSTFESKTGTWTGTVTDANNGGFIGIRSTPPFCWNMKRCNGLEWTIKLYGTTKTKRFKFVLRDTNEFNGITWTTSVSVKPGTNKVRIMFNKQIPALFAQTISDKTFRKTNVCAVQVAYSKFEYNGALNSEFELGEIRLQLLSLRAI